MSIDGSHANVTLAAGSYTASSLASALQNAINSNATFSAANVTATVAQLNGVLSITSNTYGSKSVATVNGGNGEADLLGSGAATVTAGLDVVGTINGKTAVGSGQTLTAAAGDASQGLSVNVTGGTVGARGVVNYTQGYANELGNLMTTVLGKNGSVAAATNGLNSIITNLQNSITSQNTINDSILANYQAEFSALDVTMSTLNSTSTFLTQQLAALAK